MELSTFVYRVNRLAEEIVAERVRQVVREGYHPSLDDRHDRGELADAAAVYAMTDEKFADAVAAGHEIWPWPDIQPTGSDRRRNLVKAAALIMAELERLDRAAAAEDAQNDRRFLTAVQEAEAGVSSLKTILAGEGDAA